MTGLPVRARVLGILIVTLATLLVPSVLGLDAAQAGGDKGNEQKETKARKPDKPDKPQKDSTHRVQIAKLVERDSWAYGSLEASEPSGAKVKGKAMLVRGGSGVHLEVTDKDAIPGHAYSIWFQICPQDASFTEFDTQCSLPKIINMNGSGGVAGPDGLDVTFDLPTGTAVGPTNVCGFKPIEEWLDEPCAAWDIPGILAGGAMFTVDMALHFPVRIVVKDHGPVHHVTELGAEFGMSPEAALFTATHRTDGPECQPARPVCPDAHVAVFAALVGRDR
ncbi:MAG: hypothetical protein WEB13_04800 [Dehalococcoidia bacterium]